MKNLTRYGVLFFLVLTTCINASESPSSLSQMPYIIYRDGCNTGFWSNFFVALASIDKADREGWVPVIDMERHPTLYNESHPVSGTMNAWEYFFEQPGGLSLDAALKLNSIDNGGGQDGPFSDASAIKPSEKEQWRAKEVIGKYIKIKQFILDAVDALIAPEMNSHILGVHVRGTDRRRGVHEHLLSATADIYLAEAKKLDSIYHFSQIFLACDEIETVDMFKEIFGERLIYCDTHRVSALSDETVHYHAQAFPRPMHKYLLGREVLMDALLLARCGHLLCGLSNVSLAATYFANGEQVVHRVASPDLPEQPLDKKEKNQNPKKERKKSRKKR